MQGNQGSLLARGRASPWSVTAPAALQGSYASHAPSLPIFTPGVAVSEYSAREQVNQLLSAMAKHLESRSIHTGPKGSAQSRRPSPSSPAHRRFERSSASSRSAQSQSEGPNVPEDIVNFLCENYPELLHGWANLWLGERQLEEEKSLVREFLHINKIPQNITADFINAGYDTLDSLATIGSEDLQAIESLNMQQSGGWLPGHKMRVEATFIDTATKVAAFRDALQAVASQRRSTGDGGASSLGITQKSLMQSMMQPQIMQRH